MKPKLLLSEEEIRGRQHAKDLQLIIDAARHKGIEVEPAASITVLVLRIIDKAQEQP